MSIFMNCSGECITCRCRDGCIAGNGDDDYYVAASSELAYRLKNDRCSASDMRNIIEVLKREYNITVNNDDFSQCFICKLSETCPVETDHIISPCHAKLNASKEQLLDRLHKCDPDTEKFQIICNALESWYHVNIKVPNPTFHRKMNMSREQVSHGGM